MLQIRKKLENVFKHFDTERGDFMLSQGYFKLDNGVFQIVEEGGARRHTYTLSEITIYDDTSGGIAENYTTDIALYARLVELRYNLLDLDGLAPGTSITNITESPLDLPFEGSNSFELPENYFLVSVFVNIALNKKVRYSRNATSITILDTLVTGDVINIRGFVASGSFEPSPIPPSLNDVTSQGSYTSVTIQSPDAVNANDLVNLGQVEQLISEIDIPIAFTTDASLYLDPITNELRGNIGQETENFTYTSGAQTFTLVNEPSNLIYLYVDKIPLINPLTEWSISGNVLTILNTLSGGEKITINYQFIIS